MDDGDTTVVLVIGYGHDLKLDTSIVKPDIDHCVSVDHRISGIAHGLQNVLIANPVLARRAGDADLHLTIVTDTKVEGQCLWRLEAVDVVLARALSAARAKEEADLELLLAGTTTTLLTIAVIPTKHH